MNQLTTKIKELALASGFDLVGVAAAEPTHQDAYLQRWLDNGYHGSMAWMGNHFDKRVDPTKLVSGAKSVVAVAMNYYTPHQHSPDPDSGRISRYAWGDDYHDILKKQLKQMLSAIKSWDEAIDGRAFVDTAPILDKFWAVRAGLGWVGKHSNVITRTHGSWVFLGELVLNIELDYDLPMTDFCGSCRRCIDACPTNAIVEPYVVDATRCISYWTIEHKGDIDPDIAARLGDRIFGCDDCQDVCPWNIRFAKVTDNPGFEPRPGAVRPGLAELADLTKSIFRERFRKSPIKRTKRDGLLRNVAVAHSNARK